MKRTILAIVIAALAHISYGQKIATVNTQTIIDALPEAKAADSALQAYSSKLDIRATELSNELKAKVADFEAKAKDIAPSIQESYAIEIQAKESALQKYQQTASKELQEMRNKYIETINTKISDAIKAIAKEKRYNQVLYSGSVAYSDGPDITDMVKAKLGVK